MVQKKYFSQQQNRKVTINSILLIELYKLIEMRAKKFVILLLLTIVVYTNTPCPQNCDECDESGTICFACKGDYQVNVLGGCHAPTIDKCTIYGPSNQCFRCQPTYTLIGSDKCEKTFTGCVNEGGPTQCFQCGFGTLIESTACKGVLNCADSAGKDCKKCKDGFKLDNGKCKDSSANCLQSDKSGACKKCKDGYFLSGYKCLENKIRNSRCYIQADEHKCLSCKGGYNQMEGKCLLQKQMPSMGMSASASFSDATFTQHSHQNPSFNSGFDSSAVITSNFGGDSSGSFGYGHEGQIHSATGQTSVNLISSQPPSPPQIPNCQVPDVATGNCLICTYGFVPKNAGCDPVSPLCDGHNVQTGDCFGCKFQLTLQKGRCVDKNCVSMKPNGCAQCKSGYKLNQNNVCKEFDPNCLESFNGRCQKCKSQYYSDIAGKCKLLPPFCSAANMQTGACLECVKDYQMLTPGSPCTKKLVIQNCQVLDNKNYGKCLVCVFGYFPEGTKCSKVSSLCKDHNVQNGKCKSCISDGFKLDDGKCVDPNCVSKNGDACTMCKSNFLFSESDKICKLSDPNCKTLTISACTECKPGFYISQQKICKILPNNCQSANPSGLCLTCVQGYEIYGNNCIKTVFIPNCMQVDSYNNRCVMCNDRFYGSNNGCVAVDSNCKNYDKNNGKCTSCNRESWIVQNDGTCVPPPMPTVQVQPTPTSTPTNSIISTATTTIYQSGQQNINQPQSYQPQNSGAFAYGQKINSNIVIGPQPVNPSSSISSISSAAGSQYADGNCRQYSGSKCTRCSNRYYVGPEGRCIPVNPLCKQSNSQGQCTNCYQGYMVSAGKCIISQQSDPNCKKATSQGCLQCYMGFYFSNVDKLCKKLNPLCKTSNLQSGACLTCYSGYSLNTNNGNCQVFFKDPNCKDFNTDNSCKLCAIRYYVNSNGKCSPVNPLCKNYNSKTGGCTDCYPGYGLTPDSQCVVGAVVDPNCKTPSSSGCKQCVPGFYFSTQNKCKQASPLCRTFDNKNGNCLTCYNGYQVSGGMCIVSAPKDPHCKRIQNGNCVQCYQGYLPIRGKCQQQNPLCRTINLNTNGCLTCWQGYSLQNQNCVLDKVSSSNPSSNDPYCIKTNGNGQCIQCSSGYYYNKDQSLCAQLDPICKTHDISTGDCTTCYQGYAISSNKCVPAVVVQIPNCMTVGQNNKCIQCDQGCYLTAQSECKQAPLTCATFNRNTGECTSCIVGHFLQDGICIFPAMFDQNCDYYTSAYCSRCRRGFYLSNWMCLPIDPNCTKFDEAHGQCEDCANGLYPSGNMCI